MKQLTIALIATGLASVLGLIIGDLIYYLKYHKSFFRFIFTGKH